MDETKEVPQFNRFIPRPYQYNLTYNFERAEVKKFLVVWP